MPTSTIPPASVPPPRRAVSHDARRAAALRLVGAVVGGRYRITDLLGEGGMGSVYRARDIDSGRQVAVKVLRPTEATAIKRFGREAKAAMSIVHPNVCRVHDYGTLTSGAPYLVMDLLEGETLRDRIAALRSLSLADAIAMQTQLLAALSAAHAKGVLHRDVKPANVFVTSRRNAPLTIQLIDFGLAKLIPTRVIASVAADDGGTGLTKTNVIPGTPFYLSPEQVAGARDLDERVDVWAAAVTFFEALTGRRPFNANDFPRLAAAIAKTDAPPLSGFRADLPRDLDAIVARALARDRDRRYATAAEFRAALVTFWEARRAALAASPVPRQPTLPTVPGFHPPTLEHARRESTEFEIPIFVDEDGEDDELEMPTRRRRR